MGLAYNKLDVAGSCMFSYVGGATSDLLRLASGWMLSRQEIVRLINGFMTGPSTTAGTQMNLNNPMFFRPLRYSVRIRNPTNVPVRYKIYKCTLLADAVGGTPSVYTEGTTSFNVGHNYMGVSTYDPLGNYPGSQFWKFWQQRNVYGQSANSRLTAALSPFSPDLPLTQNDGFDSPIIAPTGDNLTPTAGTAMTAHLLWETVPNPTGGALLSSTQFLHRSMPLTRLFPGMRKQLSVRVVASGRLQGFSARSHRFKHRMPRSIRPLDWILNDSALGTTSRSYMKGLSHFFIVRAYTPPPAGQRSPDAAEEDIFLTQWSNVTPQLICDWTKSFQCRIANDTFASYMAAYDHVAAGAYSYLGENQGGFRNGFRFQIAGGLPAQDMIARDDPDAGEAVYTARPAHTHWGATGPTTTASATTPFYLN